MAEFILEDQYERIINKQTKEYAKEVLSCYWNGNYRAAIVVLYTVIIFDLLQKLTTLKDIYNDRGAASILEKIKAKQAENPKNPDWETSLIQDIYNETKLITAVEKEELLHIKNERNYAAHPLINIDADNEKLELKHITKETAKDLIRKGFEIVFLRDAILGKQLVSEIINDLNSFYDRIGTDNDIDNARLAEFLRNRYFNRMTQDRLDDLFKSMWKFVFILNNDECNKNREANYHGLKILFKQNPQHYLNLLPKEEDKFFNRLEIETIKSWSTKDEKDISQKDIIDFYKSSRIMFLLEFIKQFPAVFEKLNEYAKNIILSSISHMFVDDDVEKTPLYQCKSHNKELLFIEQVRFQSKLLFLSENMDNHFDVVLNMLINCTYFEKRWIEGIYYGIFDIKDLDELCQLSCERDGCNSFVVFLINYCTKAHSYTQADQLFEYLIHFKQFFNIDNYYCLMAGINRNSQYYDNRHKNNFITQINNGFKHLTEINDANSDAERILYKKLYGRIEDKNLDAAYVFKLADSRDASFLTYELQDILDDAIKNCNTDTLKTQHPSSYPNLYKRFSNDKSYGKKFMQLFGCEG